MDSVPVDSVPVIPWPFQNPPEFRGMEITILAGSTAKIPFRGIPGITRIPADSGRNTWGTVKNSVHTHSAISSKLIGVKIKSKEKGFEIIAI